MNDIKEVKRLVTENVIEDLDGTKDLELGTAEHKASVDTTEKQVRIINEIDKTKVEIEKTEAQIRDIELRREMDYELEMKKIEIDKRDRFFKNAIAIGTGVLSAAAIVGTGILSIVYDTTGNIVSPATKRLVDKVDKKLNK